MVVFEYSQFSRSGSWWFLASPTDQNGGNLVQNVDCLLSSSLLLGPLVGWHLGRTVPFAEG